MLARRSCSPTTNGRFAIYNPYPYDIRARAALLTLIVEQGATFYRQFEWHRSYGTYSGSERPFTGPILNAAATYKWEETDTNSEIYYCTALAGGDPSLTEANVTPPVADGDLLTLSTETTHAAMSAGTYAWGDNDGDLEYDTLIVCLALNDDEVSPNPDDLYEGYLLGVVPQMGLRFTVKEAYADAAVLFEKSVTWDTTYTEDGMTFINSTAPGTDGMFDLTLSADETIDYTFTSAFYTLEAFDLSLDGNGDNVYRLLEGKIVLSKEAANSV